MNLTWWFQVTPSSVKHFTIKHTKIEMAPLTTGGLFPLWTCQAERVQHSPSFEIPLCHKPPAQTQQVLKEEENEISRFCFNILLPARFLFIETVASPGPNGNRGLSPPSNGNTARQTCQSAHVEDKSARERERRTSVIGILLSYASFGLHKKKKVSSMI